MKETITKNHPMSPNGQDSISKNNSKNSSLEEIIEARVSRRSVLKGSLALVAGSFFGINLTGCGSSGSSSVSSAASEVLLGFKEGKLTTERNTINNKKSKVTKVNFKSKKR